MASFFFFFPPLFLFFPTHLHEEMTKIIIIKIKKTQVTHLQANDADKSFFVCSEKKPKKKRKTTQAFTANKQTNKKKKRLADIKH